MSEADVALKMSEKIPSSKAALEKFLEEFRSAYSFTDFPDTTIVELIEGVAAHSFSIGYNDGVIDVVDGKHSLIKISTKG